MIISGALIDFLPYDKLIAEDASHLQMLVEKYCSNERQVFLKYSNPEEIEVPFKIRTP